jgi:hypothetical protein
MQLKRFYLGAKFRHTRRSAKDKSVFYFRYAAPKSAGLSISINKEKVIKAAKTGHNRKNCDGVIAQ